jgi:4-oxalomesaconate tautomerase
MAVTGACSLATGTLIAGTVAHAVSSLPDTVGREDQELVVRLAHPAGSMVASVRGCVRDDQIEVFSVTYQRSAQILLKGQMPIYEASDALKSYFSSSR